MWISESDRNHIENKYHRKDEPFNPLNRMAYHGIGYAEETGLSDAEILQGLEALRPRLTALPRPVARAEAIRYVLEHERLYVSEHDYFVGLYSLNRLANTVTFTPWQQDAIAHTDEETTRTAALFNESGAVSNWTDYDHVVPDWQSLLELGFPGIPARVRAYRDRHRAAGTLTPEKAALFDAMETEYTAILALLSRMCRYAEAQKNAKAPAIARCLRALHDGPPTDIYEAMQLIFLYFLLSESVDSYQVRSLGNSLDRSLYPFYVRDKAAGRYTEEEIRTFLAYFLLQWSAIGNYWGQPFYLGGTNPDGSTKYNALSCAILEVYDALDIYNPKIQLKIHKNTPERLLYQALDMVRRKKCRSGLLL